MVFIISNAYIWQNNSFLRRQVTASLARLYKIYPNEIIKILTSQIAGSDQNTVSLANQIITFSNLKTLDKKLLPYLFIKNEKKEFYPLPKFIVLCSVLNSKNISSLHYMPSKIKQHISDPYFLKHLKKLFNLVIWFTIKVFWTWSCDKCALKLKISCKNWIWCVVSRIMWTIKDTFWTGPVTTIYCCSFHEFSIHDLYLHTIQYTICDFWQKSVNWGICYKILRQLLKIASYLGGWNF